MIVCVVASEFQGAHTPPAPQFLHPQVGVTGAATWLPRLSPGLGVPWSRSRGSSWESWCRKAATNGPPGRRRGRKWGNRSWLLPGGGNWSRDPPDPAGPGGKGPAGGDGAGGPPQLGSPDASPRHEGARDSFERETRPERSCSNPDRTGVSGGLGRPGGVLPPGSWDQPRVGPRPSGALLLPPLELSVSFSQINNKIEMLKHQLF